MTWLDRFFERPRRHVFGWWSFDDVESTLLRDDGTRVRFLGPAAEDTALDIRNTGNRRWMLFELRSAASTEPTVYPLLVERRDVLDPLTSSHRRLVWRLDHIRSAKLRGAQPPDQVLWQAVDRLAIDALYCWPTELVRVCAPPKSRSPAAGVAANGRPISIVGFRAVVSARFLVRAVLRTRRPKHRSGGK